jgi:hypothetical protein
LLPALDNNNLSLLHGPCISLLPSIKVTNALVAWPNAGSVCREMTVCSTSIPNTSTSQETKQAAQVNRVQQMQCFHFSSLLQKEEIYLQKRYRARKNASNDVDASCLIQR